MALPTRRHRGVTRLTLAVAMTAAAAQVAAAQDLQNCAPAGSRVRVDAQNALLNDGAITYTVINKQRDPIVWVRIGVGGVRSVAVPREERPRIQGAPPDWQSGIVRDDDSDRFHFWWGATSDAAGLADDSRTNFDVRGRSSRFVRPGQKDVNGQWIMPIDFRSLPFSVGTASGSCWWGSTRNLSAPPEGGTIGGFAGTTARAFSSGGRDYFTVDAPGLETTLRVSAEHPVFLTFPFALSWGVQGGVYSEASIGIGMRWSPIKYASVSAQTRVGTFFFTNRTHVRSLGLDIRIPVRRAKFAEGLTVIDKYVVIGAEYFQRDGVKWAGYLKGPQWYASGRGIAIRVGIHTGAWSF
jgi:hypothetical protein